MGQVVGRQYGLFAVAGSARQVDRGALCRHLPPVQQDHGPRGTAYPAPHVRLPYLAMPLRPKFGKRGAALISFCPPLCRKPPRTSRLQTFSRFSLPETPPPLPKTGQPPIGWPSSFPPALRSVTIQGPESLSPKTDSEKPCRQFLKQALKSFSAPQKILCRS